MEFTRVWEVRRYVHLFRYSVERTVEFLSKHMCILLLEQRKSRCSHYDDDDFTASEMCCACGGGEIKTCENTDNGVTNTLGYSCVDVAIRHNHGKVTCKSNWDTVAFTASSMCCACGGGRTVTSSSASSPTQVDSEGDSCSHYRKYESRLDVMDASTTRTLQRVRCVQAVAIGAGISIE